MKLFPYSIITLCQCLQAIPVGPRIPPTQGKIPHEELLIWKPPPLGPSFSTSPPSLTLSLFKTLLNLLMLSFQCNFSAIWILVLFHCWVGDCGMKKGPRSFGCTQPGLPHSGLSKSNQIYHTAKTNILYHLIP